MADMFDKEELSIVSGLFPNTLAVANAEKQQQQNLAYERFSNAAGSRNPFGGLAGLQGMFGTAAGQDIQGVMGVQSPTTRLAALREQAAQQFDSNTPQGLAQMAQFLNQKGDSAGARQAVMLAQGQMQKSATLGKTLEDTRILGRKEIEVGVPGNPEMVQKVLTDKDGNILQKLGDPYSRFSQKTTIDARTIGPKNVLEIDKTQAEVYAKSLNAAANTLPTLQRMQDLIDRGVISGTAANWRAETLGVLQGLGANTDTAKTKLANTEAFNKELINLLQGVIKQYGTNPSNIDVKTALQGLPELVKSPEGVQKVLTTLTNSNRDTYNEAKTGLEYYRKNQGSFTGYQPKVPLGLVDMPKIRLPKPLNEMTAAELEEALK